MDQAEGRPVAGGVAFGSRIEELFVRQNDSLAFHNNKEENHYRRQEERLSSLMLDKALTNEKHMEYAQASIALTDRYKSGFLQSLHSLNADVDRHLAAFQHELDVVSTRVPQSTQHLTILLEKLRRWLILSMDLQKARLLAAQTIVMRVDCDNTVPNAIIRNDGRTDVGWH